MFSIDFSKDYTATVTGMKVDGELRHISNNAYWKKDFLEASLSSYAKYLKHGNVVYLEDYLKLKKVPGFVLNNLVTSKEEAANLPAWLSEFSGQKAVAKIEVFQYYLRFANGNVKVMDSLLLYKTYMN